MNWYEQQWEDEEEEQEIGAEALRRHTHRFGYVVWDVSIRWPDGGQHLSLS